MLTDAKLIDFMKFSHFIFDEFSISFLLQIHPILPERSTLSLGTPAQRLL
jgi:hypothetical protein